MKCDGCGAIWLRVLFEAPHFSKSGHWYDVLMPREFNPQGFEGTKETVESVCSKSLTIFTGGSLFDGKVQPHTGLIKRLV